MNAFSPLTALNVREAAPADRDAIAGFVTAASDAQPFHLPQWSEAVERAAGHKAVCLIAERHGTIVGLLPLSDVRSPLFGRALVSTGFGVGGGVLGQGVDALAEAAWTLARARSCASVELRGGPVPEGWDRREGVHAGFARDLPAGEDEILAAIPRKQRAEVRRAQGLGLDVTIGRDLDAHHRVYAESVRNLGTPVFPRTLFEEMLAAFGEEANILTISRNGKPLSSVLSFYFNNAVYPYWGGGTAEARQWRANELAYYELMRHAARRGCTRFDFGRSKLGTGAYAFKKNWGFEPRPLVYATKGEAREVNPLSPRYRLQVEAWKKLPLWLANRLGPPIARGLA